MERKIIKIGNSLGVILPSAYLDEINVSHGDIVDIDYDEVFKTIVISSKDAPNKLEYLDELVRASVDRYLKEKGM